MKELDILERLAMSVNEDELEDCFALMDKNLQKHYQDNDMDGLKEYLAKGKYFANEVAVYS